MTARVHLTDQVRVNITPEQKRELERIAANRARPVSSIIRDAIRLYLRETP